MTGFGLRSVAQGLGSRSNESRSVTLHFIFRNYTASFLAHKCKTSGKEQHVFSFHVQMHKLNDLLKVSRFRRNDNRVRIPNRHPGEVSATELFSDDEMERSLGE